jgi:apolipoprotein N-acyltransferase
VSVASGTIAGMADVMTEPADAPSAPPPDPRPRVGAAAPRPRAGWWWPPLAALGSGLFLLLAFPPFDLWPSAFVGVALLAVATHRRGFWAGLGLGLLAGLALLIPLLSWAGGYVGAVWLILPFGEAVIIGLMGGAAALVTPVLERWRWSWPVVTGALWVLQEAVRDRAPFGGFPWGRIAFSQADSPLVYLAALGGAPLVAFAVGAVGGALAALAYPPVRRDRRALVTALAVLLLLPSVPLVLRSGPDTAGTPVRVAVVQGNVPRLGLEFNAQRRAVLDNHVDATLALAERVAAGVEPRPDLVVWPENASDIDPIANRDAGLRIDQAARAIGVPILVGGLIEGPGAGLRNVGIVWDPVTGPGQTYTKMHPVPFAEYMPIRTFARLITDKVDLVRRDFTPGTTSGVLAVGPTTVGDVICFEVAYDNIVRDTVTGGAQLLVVQTNNATFNEAEARQQLAMVRLRAVEHGRPALMASTVGVSGFVDETGNVYDATQFNAEAVIVRDVFLRTTRTMATRLGLAPELLLAALALGAIGVAVVLRRRRTGSVTGAERQDEAKG